MLVLQRQVEPAAQPFSFELRSEEPRKRRFRVGMLAIELDSWYYLKRDLQRIKPALRKQEVIAVGNRLASLSKPPVGIPKGIDPNRLRAQRPR